MDRRAFLASAASTASLALLPGVARAGPTGPIRFDQGWRPLNFPRLTPTRYGLGGRTLTIEGDASSSLIYRPAPPQARGAGSASWSWAVSSSVPATDLSRKGGDDRNISVYFVFMDAAAASRLSPDTSPRALLSNRSGRVLIYVWGGGHRPGTLLASPYLRGRGVTVVLRPAGTGRADARVDLAADHARAFGGPPGTLVGLAVSADSDDTGSRLRARLSDLTLE
ncbi:DUF3047 domain-containing protein [Paracoccus salsus]|uniref:DUF3047 domain-containing protein n=1 Tax=Paracoccus salsus TaxID=2911061 RepID=UPI001F1DC2C4|nr:DUF3047 domain-containing protein [Paracoccus salsus]MCF3974891.1 DUF3047 domain-containing protein [Paracoccus salsus]